MLFFVFFCVEKQQVVRFRCSSNSGIRAKDFVKDLVCGRNRSFLCFCPSLRMLFARTRQIEIVEMLKTSTCCYYNSFSPSFVSHFLLGNTPFERYFPFFDLEIVEIVNTCLLVFGFFKRESVSGLQKRGFVC